MGSAQGRHIGCVAVDSFVNSLHQISGLLKLNGQVEGSRHSDTRRIDASLVIAALLDLICPKGKTVRIGSAAEEVEIMLVNEELCLLDLITARIKQFGGNSHSGRPLAAGNQDFTIGQARRCVADAREFGCVSKAPGSSGRFIHLRRLLNVAFIILEGYAVQAISDQYSSVWQ